MDDLKPRIAKLEDLGAFIRETRRSQRLRIDDASALMGVSVDLMSRLENGQGSVRLDKVISVLDGLGLTLLVLPKTHPIALQVSHAPVEGVDDETFDPTATGRIWY